MPGGRWRRLSFRSWGWGAMPLLALLPGTAVGMTLNVAVGMGLASDPNVRGAVSDVKAAETDVKVARNGYLPAVSISGGPRNFRMSGPAYEVTGTQMLYDWGRTASKVEGAKASRRQLSQDELVKRDGAALDIVAVYLDIVATQRLLEADDRHIQRLEQVRQMTDTRSGGGYADRSEPERARLELARAEEQITLDRGQLRNDRDLFRTLVGAEPTALEEPAPAPIAGYIASRDLGRIIQESPTYLKAMEDTRYAQANLRQARASLLPQLNLEASTLRRDIGGRAETDTVVALRFRMDTFQGLASFQRESGARQRVESARWKEAAAERDIRRDVENLLDTADTLQAREKTLSAQVTDSAGLGSLYQEQFSAGKRDIIDLLNVQRERFEAERTLISTHIDQIRAQYQTAARLGLIGPLLEGGLASL
jgi:adhesin transport system outer membrane protein